MKILNPVAILIEGKNFFDHDESKTYSIKTRTKSMENFYEPNAANSERPKSDFDTFLSDNKITIKGSSLLNPILTFSESTFGDVILKSFSASSFKDPTIIQSCAWPYLLNGRDTVAIAQTGSGKTLACLILVPTRELCQQIEVVTNPYAKMFGINCVSIYGGAPRMFQERKLARNPQIVVGCPGRLLDFLQSDVLCLDECSFLVLDEADRMLDMGFEPQIRKIIHEIPCEDRQTTMFSATWPTDVHALANKFLTDYVHISIGSTSLSANKDITQHIRVVNDANDKSSELNCILNEILSGDSNKKILIFCETKRKCDNMSYSAKKSGWPSDSLHGDKTQSYRDQVLRDFKNEKCRILFATDVASRGLDVNDIDYVINLDFPNTTEDYIHRIGRTGRCGKKGTSYTIMCPDDSNYVKDLIKILEEAGQDVPDDLTKLQGCSSSNKNQRQAFNRYNTSYQRQRSYSGYGQRRQSNYGRNNYNRNRFEY